MYDPDALYSPMACELTEEQQLTKRAADLARHRRNYIRLQETLERDRRWRRRWQVVLAGALVVALIGVLWLGGQAVAWLHGEESQWLAVRVSKVKLGTITTTLAGLRMFFAWRRGRRRDAVAGVVDATTSILPGTR